MTQLHAGGKFDHDSYKVSGGLHGVGISVVNALSEKLELRIFRDGVEYFIEFENGKSLKPLKKIGKSSKRGTNITFLPSKEIFSSIKFSSSVLQKRMRELAFLNRGISMILIDKTSSKKKKYEHFILVLGVSGAGLEGFRGTLGNRRRVGRVGRRVDSVRNERMRATSGKSLYAITDSLVYTEGSRKPST